MKSLIVVLVVVFIFSAVVSAEWKSFDNSRVPANAKVNLLSATGHEIKVEITIPGYHMEKVMINGKECVMIQIPGSVYLMKQGFPMVPMMSKLVKIHERCDIKLKLISKEEVEETLPAPIVPSKGHLTRNIDPETVPFEFGPIYSEDVFWPEEKDQFTIGKPFLFSELRGVRVEILPILANHVQMKMKVLKKAVIALVCEGDSYENTLEETRAPRVHNKLWSKLYQENFLNYTEVTERGVVPPESNKNLVVVTPADFEGLLGNWIAWKKECGYTVTVKAVPTGTSASTIKSYLQGLYDVVDGRPGYVVLIGDANAVSETATPMPTFKGAYEGAAADRMYVRLAGNDNYPDAFISRISGDANTIPVQLNKIVTYEQSASGAWLSKGICIASNQGSPTDKERAEWLQNGGGSTQKVPIVAGGLIGYGYKSFDDIYDPDGTVSKVSAAVNDGRGIICYIGHGSSTSWGSTGFSVTNVNALTNGDKLPVIWSVACVNGDFARTGTCFAEGWLRKANGGAVAFEGASTNEAWVPPCDKQAATINAIINQTYKTFGALEMAGTIKGLEVWGDTNSSQGNQMAEQCNLFGDCTMVVKTK